MAAAVGAAGLAYALRPKMKVPATAIVNSFDRDRYLGKLKEVARLPNLIEIDLRDLTEEYTQKDDGNIEVITRAFNPVKNKVIEATGSMRSKGRKTRGQLQVAYYLPIYLDYNVLDVDENYCYALVAGNSMDYLWLLSRENSMPELMKQRFLVKAAGLGFDIDKLEWMDY